MAGGGGSQSGDGQKKARIEIIPLIDVIFFLLATFVLFTLSLNKSNGFSVQLPKVENSTVRDPSGVTITITEDNQLGWDKDPISLEEFVTRVMEYKNRVGEDNARFLINADENANYASARYVFDQIKRAGIQRVHIETRILPENERIR